MGKPVSRSVCVCAFHPFLRQELSRLIQGHSMRVLTCPLDAGSMAHREKLRIPRASLYVTDSPRKEHAEYLVSEILSRFPRARVLVITEKLDEPTCFALLRSGAAGLLRYSDMESRLLEALETLASGGFWVPRNLMSRFVQKTLRGRRMPGVRPPGAVLSRREKEILELLLQNLSNKEIASRLSISPRTVKFHVSHLLAKYGVKGRADLLLMQSA